MPRVYEILDYTDEIQLRVHDDMHWVPVVEHLIFVIFWCSIYFDMAIAVLGVTTRLCSVPAKAENISNQHGWRAVNILNKPAIF